MRCYILLRSFEVLSKCCKNTSYGIFCLKDWVETVDCHSNDRFDQLRAHAKQRLPFATQPNPINQRFFSFHPATHFCNAAKEASPGRLAPCVPLKRLAFKQICSEFFFIYKIMSTQTKPIQKMYSTVVTLILPLIKAWIISFDISGDARRGRCSRRPEGQPCAQRQAGPGRVERMMMMNQYLLR